jgi:hypothetical protein
MKYTGSSWDYVGAPGFTSESAEFFSIAMNSSGIPYIAFVDRAYTEKVTVMEFNGSSWIVVGTPGFSSYVIGSTDIKFNQSNQPCIVYEDGINSLKITLMIFNGTSWVNWGIPGPPAESDINIKFAIDQTGVAYVPFEDPAKEDTLSVAKLSGSSWIIYSGLSSGTVNNMNVCMSPSDVPYIVYSDGGDSNRLSVKNFNGSAWNFVGNGNFSSTYSLYPVLSFNSSGIPYVAFFNDPLLSVMDYPFPSGISEKDNFSFTLYPNPCMNLLNIIINERGISKIRNVEIFNLAGERIGQFQTCNFNIQVEVNSFPPGIYLIKIGNENSIWTRKFCKI